MNDFLSNLSENEIRELALKQLNEEESLSLKIVKVDKEYKKHNKKAICSAIANGLVIVFFIVVVLDSKSDISHIGTDDFRDVCDSVSNRFQSIFPPEHIMTRIYAELFDGVADVIDTVGLVGILLFNRVIRFISGCIGNFKRSIEIKRELDCLKEQLNKGKSRS